MSNTGIANTPLSPEKRELDIRASIARKESICPYAPGLARFLYLPEIKALEMEHVYYLAKELKAFYETKEQGERVGRWILLPHKEWETHSEAQTYSEHIYWLLNAAFYHLAGDKKSVHTALDKSLAECHRGHNGEILVPIVGKRPCASKKSIPAKSLFCSALSPLYRSKHFYRYSPHCMMPLVYAAEFQELRTKHSKVTENITFRMAYVGLYEVFGEDLELDLNEFRMELPIWGTMIDRVAAVLRSQITGENTLNSINQGHPSSNLLLFRQSPQDLIAKICKTNMKNLSILKRLIQQTQAHPQEIIQACFAGTSLYVTPDYLQSL